MTAQGPSDERVRNLVAGEFLGGAGEVIAVEQTRALWTTPEGSATKFHEFVGKFCTSSRILDVCGIAAVGDDGTVEFKLTDFVCLRRPAGGENFDRIVSPAFVLATPRSAAPVHVTTQVTSQTDDVLVKVFAWDPSGAPAPRVRFDWRCCVRLVTVVG